MLGKTGVISDYKEAKETISNWNSYREQYVLLKMTLGGDLYNGMFDRHKTVIGTEIISLKEIKK
jgi:hypothetical protein